MSFRPNAALAVASLLSSVPAVAQSTVYFAGIGHRPLGQAQIGISGGFLFVGNIGTTGQDGVRILTTDIESLRLEMPFDPALMITGAERTLTVEGELDGSGPPTELQTLCLRKTSTGLLLVPNYAGVGVPTYTASVFNGAGDLVYQQTGLQAGALQLQPNQPIVLDIGATQSGGHDMTAAADLPVMTPAGLFTARRIRFIPEGTSFSSLMITEAQLRSRAESSFRVFDERIGMFGLPHTGVGDARLESALSHGQLVVSNIGSSGQDGVRVELDDHDGWVEVHSTLGGPLQPGASIRLESLGTIDGAPDSPYASIEARQASSNVFPIEADYSAVAPTSLYIIIKLMNVQVTSYNISGSGQSELVRTAAFPSRYTMGISTTASWDSPVLMQAPSGAVFTGDSVTVVPVAPAAGTELIGEIRMLGSNLSQVIINDEELVPPSPIGVTYCSPAVPHSGGLPARLAAYGSALLADQEVYLRAFDLPANMFGYFLASQTSTGGFIPPGSSGRLCIAGTIGRYVQQLGSSGPMGVRALTVDLGAIPTFPTHAVAVGETWHWQLWFRDFGPTSNFTDAVRVTFH